MSAHAWLSPSSAESWTTCAAYPQLAEQYKSPSSYYSAEGTYAHWVSEMCLDFGIEPSSFIGKKRKLGKFEIEWTEKFADFLQPGIDRIRELGGEFYGERRVDVSHWTIPGQFGTLDRGIVRPDLIIIGDLKFGAGVPVEVTKNLQMILYGLGFWREVARHKTKAKDFLFIIDQPRVAGKGGEWETTLDELLEIGEWIKERAQLTTEKSPKRTASEKGCMFCPARKSEEGCAEYDRWHWEKLDIDVEDLDLDIAIDNPVSITRKFDVLTAERRAFIAKHSNTITKWLKEIHTKVLRDAIEGRATPGVKAILGKPGNRRFVTDEQVEEVLTERLNDRAFNKKLISPAQAEKLIGKKELQTLLGDFIERPPPGVKLVSDTHTNPAYVGTIALEDDEIEDLDA